MADRRRREASRRTRRTAAAGDGDAEEKDDSVERRRPREMRVLLRRLEDDGYDVVPGTPPAAVERRAADDLPLVGQPRVLLERCDAAEAAVRALQRRGGGRAVVADAPRELVVVLERSDAAEAALRAALAPRRDGGAEPVAGGRNGSRERRNRSRGGGTGRGGGAQPVAGGAAAVVAAPPPVRPVIAVLRRSARDVIVARRVTYREGVGTPADALEELCRRPFTCGPLNVQCAFCGARFFAAEGPRRERLADSRVQCCHRGRIVLPPLRCPAFLRELFTGEGRETREFLDNVRVINSLFAMATFKTSAPAGARAAADAGQGHWCFSVTGQVYHHTMGLPDAADLREPRLNHYYFLDVGDVLARRNAFVDHRVREETVRGIERCLRENNPYVRAYRSMGQVLEEEMGRRDGEGRLPRDVDLAFRREGDMNRLRRRFAMSESRTEIAAIFYGDDIPFAVDLRLYPRREVDVDDGGGGDAAADPERRHELRNLNPMADLMVYPLLFPCGENGYSTGIPLGGEIGGGVRLRATVTIRQFYRYRLQIRDVFSLLHNGGKLFQQYVVDAWARAEANQLWWYRQHQNRFRFAAQRAVEKVIRQHPDVPKERIGRLTILPTCFVGGPRDMQRQYLDAMVVVSRHGKPDLFITFTCNPSWPEIADNLEYRQKWENRPDLVCLEASWTGSWTTSFTLKFSDVC